MIAITTPPLLEPVTLQEAKDHLRVTEAAEDSLIGDLVVAARQFVENYTTRPLVTQTRTWFGNALVGGIELSPNLQSISSIKYLDSDGAQQTLAASDYRVDTKGLIGSVCPAYGKTWPTVRDVSNSVEIEFICGYGDPADVPNPIKQAMLLLVGDFYEMREETVIGAPITPTGAVKMLLNNYRIITL